MTTAFRLGMVPNKVLGEPAPEINKNENPPQENQNPAVPAEIWVQHTSKLLPSPHKPRRARRQLPQTTTHLFNCQSDPTELNTRILWEDPPAAAAFLGLDLGGEAVALDDND